MPPWLALNPLSRRDHPRQDQYARSHDGLRDEQSRLRANQQSLRCRADARREQWQRGGDHRGRRVAARYRQRHRRKHSRPFAFLRHCRDQAHRRPRVPRGPYHRFCRPRGITSPISARSQSAWTTWPSRSRSSPAPTTSIRMSWMPHSASTGKRPSKICASAISSILARSNPPSKPRPPSSAHYRLPREGWLRKRTAIQILGADQIYETYHRTHFRAMAARAWRGFWRAGEPRSRRSSTRIKSATVLSSADYSAQYEKFDNWRSQLLRLFADFDILLCPVNVGPAPLHGTFSRPSAAYTQLFDLTGWPSTVIRAGTSPEGLPLGIQCVAQPWREDLSLAVAGQLEAALGPFPRSSLTAHS